MRIKVDENLPDSLAAVLQEAGHDADTVSDEGLAGAVDSAVIAAATAQDRLVLTLDRGFADIRSYRPGTHGGVLVLRLEAQGPRALRLAVEEIIASVDLTSLRGANAVWQAGRLHMRRPSIAFMDLVRDEAGYAMMAEPDWSSLTEAWVAPCCDFNNTQCT